MPGDWQHWLPVQGQWDTRMVLGVAVQYVAAGLMIFGGVVPYVPQYLDIRRTKNAEGFSTFVCLTLLIANTLRILFWFGRHFELPLLAQSVVMIVTMFAMVHLCTVVKAKSEIIASKPRVFGDVSLHPPNLDEPRASYEKQRRRLTDMDTQYFWRWTDFSSYVEFMFLFTGITGCVTYFLLDVTVYVEALGFLAVFFEAMLGAPQFYRNLQNKSTQGMSVKMVLMWTSGDIFKTVYFLLRHTPPQFYICGMLQVGLDIAILCQVWLYRSKPAVQ